MSVYQAAAEDTDVLVRRVQEAMGRAGHSPQWDRFVEVLEDAEILETWAEVLSVICTAPQSLLEPLWGDLKEAALEYLFTLYEETL